MPLLLLPWISIPARAQNPQWEWARSFGDGAGVVITQVEVDTARHHVYVAGSWEASLSSSFPVETNPSTRFSSTYGLRDGFLAKYDQDANLLWAFKLGGENGDQVNSIALDREGHVYITGTIGEGSAIYFSGTSPHTGNSTLSNARDEDFFLAKYSADGEFIWVRRSTTNSGDLNGKDLTLTSDAVYAVGTYSDWATFESLPMANSPDGNDIFLVKYNLDGEIQWIAEAGSNGNDEVHGVVADATGVYYIGNFDGSTLDIKKSDGSSGTTEDNKREGRSDIILLDYQHNGTVDWSRTIAGNGYEVGYGIGQDSDHLYITGAIENNTDFPGYSDNPLSTSEQQDIFIASLAKSNGSTGWVQVLPSSNVGNEFGRSLDTDASGKFCVTGSFAGDLQFPEGILLSAIGEEDVFVAAYTTQGDFQWAEQAGSPAQDIGRGVAAGPGGSIYISGGNYGEMTLGPLILADPSSKDAFLAKLLEDSPSSPSNDDPCTALLLPVGETCDSQIYSNVGATGSGIPDPGCGNYVNNDVWFKVVVPPSGNLFVETKGSSNDNYPPNDGWFYRVEMAVYSGSCNSLIQEACYSNNSGYSFRAASAYLYDKTPGDTVWIRIWEAYGNDPSQFAICVFDPGQHPAWNLPSRMCSEDGIVDLETTLSGITSGSATQVAASSGVPDPADALGTPDGVTARLWDNGDWIRLDLTDTIPVGEAYRIHFRSNALNDYPTRMTLWVSQNNADYVEHSFKPETENDELDSYLVIAEHPTRYLWIANDGAGGGGFALDGLSYAFRGTRGGSWSGPGVSGSLFDPAGLQGPVSITYSVGGPTRRRDSTRTITVFHSDAGTLGSDTSLCSGDPDLTLKLSGHQGSVLKWERSSDNFLTASTLPVTDSHYTPGGLTQATFRVIVQDGACEPDTSDAVTVTVLETPSADPGPYGDVCGKSTEFHALPSIGTGTWRMVAGSGKVTFSPSENEPKVRVNVDQYGSYTFAWSESNGRCMDDSLITVEFIEQAQADAGSGGEICGSSYPLAALPGSGTGIWTQTGGPGTASFDPSATFPDAVVSVDLPGSYQFTWTETTGICEDRDSIELNFLETLAVDAGPDVFVCEKQQNLKVFPEDVPGRWIQHQGPGKATFSPSETDPLARVRVDAYGVYLFTWEVREGFCQGVDSLMVTFLKQPEADAGPDQELDYKFSTYLEAVPASELEAVSASETEAVPALVNAATNKLAGTWSLISGSAFIEYPDDPATRVSGLALGENIFQWTLTSDFCPPASDQVSVWVRDIQTYTVITPNNDGLNDFLVFPGVDEIPAVEIIIYNRWGREVYRDKNYQNNWDGRDQNGTLLIADTYYYLLRIPPDRTIKSFVEIRRSE